MKKRGRPRKSDAEKAADKEKKKSIKLEQKQQKIFENFSIIGISEKNIDFNNNVILKRTIKNRWSSEKEHFKLK